MRLLVCGSRDWPGTWEDIAIHFPDHCDPAIGDVTIIHGACSRKAWRVSEVTGARAWCEVSVDMLADRIARGLGFDVEPYPVNHRLDGPWPAAGPRRNARMLRGSKPDRGLAFGPLWRSPTRHTGTGDMVSRMLRAGITVLWVAAPGAEAVDLAAFPEPPR